MYLTSSFAKVQILEYATTEKTIKSELFTPGWWSEKMFQEIGAGKGRCRRGGLGVVGRGSGFTLALP